MVARVHCSAHTIMTSEPPAGMVARLRQVFSRDRRGSASRSPTPPAAAKAGGRGADPWPFNGRGNEDPDPEVLGERRTGNEAGKEEIETEMVRSSPQTSSSLSAPNGDVQSGQPELLVLPEDPVGVFVVQPDQQHQRPPQIATSDEAAAPQFLSSFSSTLPILDAIPARGSNEISLISLNMLADHVRFFYASFFCFPHFRSTILAANVCNPASEVPHSLR